jgi:hypothetical protein
MFIQSPVETNFDSYSGGLVGFEAVEGAKPDGVRRFSLGLKE